MAIVKNLQGIRINRKSIPDRLRLELWLHSGGRCQLRGCNKPLWRHEMTMNDGNFAEIAHIIGAKPAAARGGSRSAELQIEFSNLMMLCSPCHHDIDTNDQVFSVEELTGMKAEHEERIAHAVESTGDAHRTNILICAIKIGDRFVPIKKDDTKAAIWPKYPADSNGIVIQDEHFDANSDNTIWQHFVDTRIKNYVKSHFLDTLDERKIKHLSIFAIGPIPLLMYLGKCIGDTVPADVFQSYRLEANPWKRLEGKPYDLDFITRREHRTSGKIAFLKLAISDSLPDAKWQKMDIRPDSVYEITVNEPSSLFAQNRAQADTFIKIYRKLLNEIQENHGEGCEIYLLPAIPNSFAVECGRVLLPRKDCRMIACQFDREKYTFRPVLQIL
jgi:SMODS-associated and fused to various effectors sensor domain